MDPCVIDSSIGISWVHPGQATSASDRLLAECEAGAIIHVPLLWFVEMANGLLVLQRRRKMTSAERISALERLEDLQLQVDDESARAAFHEVSALADKHGLSAYDATYLELAIRLKLNLASRDDLLCRAATASGIKVI